MKDSNLLISIYKSIGIDAAHKSLVFYAHGVFFEPDCGNKPENLDHAVLLVGYGNLNGQDYWLVKNRFLIFVSFQIKIIYDF